MKTICTRDGNRSIHLFNDECFFEKSDNKIFVKDVDGNTILVLSNLAFYLTYENITAPDNWDCGKYRYMPDRGWIRCSEWKFPYHNVFDTLHKKHLQLVQCLYEKSLLNDEDLLLLSECKSLEQSIIEYKINNGL
jgi:hypothetical protein